MVDNMSKKDVNNLLHTHSNLEIIKNLDEKFVIVSKSQRNDILTDVWNYQKRISYLEKQLNKIKGIIKII